MKTNIQAPTLSFSNQKEFEEWLQAHHTSPEGLWVKFAKKASGIASVSPEETLEVALCYGWIDGQRKPFDEQYYLNKYTPRRMGSLWSKRNCAIAERLINEQKMQPSGMKEITAAQADGRWERAYDSSKTMELPADFIAAVQQIPEAYAFFQTLNKTNLFAIQFRLQTAKKPETRALRMAKIVAQLKEGIKFHTLLLLLFFGGGQM